MAEEFCEEYASSMKDLTFNSKPHITMLTMLAEENIQYAPQIVKVIEAHLQKVRPEAKLPAMYLIDSILKNVGQVYQSLFTQNIVSNFCSVFEKVDEKVRAQMYKLRQTWTEIFPNKKLYAIDIRVKEIDPAWPILAQPPPQQSIHVNPRFLKLPAEENNANKKVQEIQEEEMRQQLLAKQQELLKLQRQKLELELLQTQVLVEEQKRQLILKEQQLRAHQTTSTDVQKALSLQQQLSNVAALAAAASQNVVNVEGQKSIKPGKVSAPGTRDHGNSLSAMPQTMHSAVANNKNPANVGVMNKKGYSGQLHGDASATIIPGNLSANASSSKHGAPPMSASSSHNSLPHPSKQGCLNQNSELTTDGERMQSKGLNLKGSPRKGIIDKGGKDIGKGKDESKKQSPSPKKGKSSKTESKSSDVKHKSGGKSSKTSTEKDKRSRSKSTSPVRGKGDTGSLRGQSRKGDRWQSSSLQARDRRTAVHSRARSPGRQDKVRDRDERIVKRGRRSPRREKENDGKGLDGGRNKSASVSRDVDLRTTIEHGPKIQKRDGRSGEPGPKPEGEPPYKKSKIGDPELDEIFGDKDQDYRQLDQPIPKLSPISERQGWAQYKASRPDEFKNPLRSRDNHLDPRDPFYFGKHDLDLRTPGPGSMPGVRGASMGYPNWNVRDSRGVSLGRDNRPPRSDRLSSQGHNSRGLSNQDPRLHMMNRSVCYQATQESDPNIPRALMFDRGAEIMKQADLQLKCGQLTVEQHREILEQLAKLYELQRMRHLQREQRMRESMLLQSEAEVITISPDGSPVREEPGSTSNSRKQESGEMSCENEASSEKVELASPKEDSAGRRLEEEPKKLDPNESSKSHMSPRISSDTKLGVEVPLPDISDVSSTVVVVDQESSTSQPQPDSRPQKDCVPVLENEVIIREEKEASQSAFASALPTSSSPPRHRGFHRPQPIHTVMIDDKPREVRFFGDTAVVLLDNNDPREIAFRGPPQEVIIGKQVVRLGFREKNKDVEIDGCRYPIRFGAPTREIIINDIPYSAVFGGPPINVMLGGKQYTVRLCGPTPEVYFGDKPRYDLLPQIGPEVGGRPAAGSRDSTSARRNSPTRWVTSTIGRDYEPRDWRHSNSRDGSAQYPSQRQEWHDDWRGGGRYGDEAFRHERAGFREDRRPPPHNRGDYRDFEPWGRRGEPGHRDDFRPGARGSLPGRGHSGPRGSPQTMMDDYYDRESRSSPYRESVDPRGVGGGGGGYYQDGRFGHGSQMMGSGHQGLGPMNAPPHRFENPGPGMTGPPHQMPHHGGISNQGMRYGSGPPYGYGPQSVRGHRYPPQGHPEYGYQPTTQPMMPGVPRFPGQIAGPQPQINIKDLFEKLVSKGIIPQVTSSTEKKETEEEQTKSGPSAGDTTKTESEKEKPPVIELNAESLKVKYSFVITQLYCGIQCSSCGVRFTAEQTDKYAQHLDWHFRQNRKEKDSARKALSRKWYYDVQDWVQFEEIEDLEERARSFFEIQASEEQTEGAEDAQPSVPAGENEEDKRCAVCHELFELYWNEDSEEWHYRVAIREDDKNYHPLCYEDLKEQQFQEANIEEKGVDDTKESLSPSQSVVKMEISTDEVPTAEDKMESGENIDRNDDNGKGDASSDFAMEDSKQQMTDVMVKEESTSLAMESEEPDNEKSEQANNNGVVSMETEQEKNSDETSENVGVAASEPEELAIEIKTEPLQEEEYEPLPIFNVMSSSYTVPPLIGLEVEDDVPESMNVVETLEVVEDIPMESELPGTEENIDAVNTDGIEENVPCEALENLNVDRDVDDDSKLKNETPGEVSSSMGDVPDVEEEVSYNTVNVTTSDDVLDHENVEVSSSGVNDDAIEDETVIVKMEPMEQDETEFGEKPKFETVVKREPVECDERQVALDPESETFTSVLDTEDNPLLGAVVSDITSLDESLERDDRSSFLDVCVKKSPPVHSPVLHQVQVELDEDISLKESSDVLSEFAFDPVPSPNETCQPPKDSSLNTNDKDEDGHATKDNDEQTDGRSRFVVLPPVSRGTELSGLCTIM